MLKLLIPICLAASLVTYQAASLSENVVVAKVKPAVITEPVPTDADDPAIWVHPTDPSKSLILGTDKGDDGIKGGLFAFNLDGKIVQKIEGLARPNNVDVEQGVVLKGKTEDIAVVTERLNKRLLIYSIDTRTGKLTDITGPDTGVFQGEEGENAAPMGISLYKRADDKAVFAIVGRKEGPADGYLWVYRLTSSDGKVNLQKVSMFGAYSGKAEIESIAVDDASQTVYYSDEGFGVRSYRFDSKLLTFTAGKTFGTTGWSGDHEGIGIYRDGGKSLLVCTDQIEGGSIYRVFDPEGSTTPILAFNGGADSTDGLDVTSANLGSHFPEGVAVAMNSNGRNFFIFDVRDVKR